MSSLECTTTAPLSNISRGNLAHHRLNRLLQLIPNFDNISRLAPRCGIFMTKPKILTVFFKIRFYVRMNLSVQVRTTQVSRYFINVEGQ
jgi:hypothetical protein